MKINQKFYIGLRDINLNNKLSNTALLAYLENVACMHSEHAGYGILNKSNKENMNTAWIIASWKVEVLNRPLFNDIIDVTTWSRGSEKYFSYRDFEVFDLKCLYELKELFLGKTGIFDHDPKGSNQTSRIFFTEVVRDPIKKQSWGKIIIC